MVTAPLRNALQELTDELTGDRLGEQVERVRLLPCAHTIRLLGRAEPGEPRTWRFNCIQYALGLQAPPPAVECLCRHGAVFLGTDFLSWLVNRLPSSAPNETGSLIVYLDGGAIKHVGISTDGRVASKWGGGHLWDHGIFEVPASYGDAVAFYRPPEARTAGDLFLDYARERLEPPLVDAIIGGAAGA